MTQRLLPSKSKCLLSFPNQIATSLLTLFLLLTVFSSTVFAQATIWYVSESGGYPQHDGISWAAASSDLQAIINISEPGDQIWVAGGSYPTSQFANGYVMKEGVKIYGGFAGTEASLAERDLSIRENTSIIQATGDRHFAVDNSNNGLSNAALLDGFTLSGGTQACINNFRSSPRIVNVTFTALTGIAGMYNTEASPTLINCLIVSDQPLSIGLRNVQHSSPTLINCTIGGNDNQNGSIGMENTEWSNPSIINTIIAGSSLGMQNGSTSNPIFTNSVVRSIDGNNNFPPPHFDPLYVDAAAGNYSLQLCSEAVNGGTNSAYGPAPDMTLRDLGGNPRFYDHGTVDMGAYEYQGTRSSAIPGIFFVKEGAGGSGYNWDCATGSIQEAINLASEGQQVWVGSGTYKPAKETSFVLKEGVKVYGGFAGTEGTLAERDLSITNNKSILVQSEANSDGIYANVVFSQDISRATLLDGFTISGSRSAVESFHSSPTLANLIIKNNGSGIRSAGSYSTIINCLMFGNYMSLSNFYGSVELLNCTIISYEGSKVYTRLGGTTVRNSIITDELSTDEGQVVVKYSFVKGIANPDQADHNIPGNIDPLFADAAAGDYRLQLCSPLINRGYNFFAAGQTPDLSFITTDLEGNSRIRELGVDIGAYEYAGPARKLATDGDVASGTISYDYTLSTNTESCKILARLEPNGAAPVTGNVDAKVWVAGSQPKDFLKRHYQITPGTNAGNATAKVTLYFTQQEFDAFNEVSSTQLPHNGADTENYKANLRIEKRPGGSGDESGLPNSYTGTVSTFKPSEANGNVVWNADGEYWEVSFDVTGFSGLFVKTTQSALPLNLISFTATKEAGSNLLQWSTANEVNTDNFEIQSSGDAKNFIKIATMDASNTGDHQYSYADRNSYNNTVYYRLKMSDQAANGMDGAYTFSKIISVKNSNEFAIYPNPAAETVTFQVNNSLLKTTAVLYDISGRRIQNVAIKTNKQQIQTKSLPSGLYILKFSDGTAERFMKE